MRKLLIYAVSALLCLSLAGCAPGYTRYQKNIYDTFDTHIMVLGYARNQAEFDRWAGSIHQELRRLHMLYDIYNHYDGLSNLRTVNDKAGLSPVEVDQAIIDLLVFAKAAYRESGGVVNVALGSLLRIWHDYRTQGIASPQTASLPPAELLRAAMAHTNIRDVVIDQENRTVFLRDAQMSLDVGALAKGFAVERAMELAREDGFSSGLINGGGDIRITGSPRSERDYWVIGVRNPAADYAGGQADSLYDSLLLSGEMAVATSGDYQRYYTVNGRRYSHIIDPATGMPADRYAGVTVIHPDAGMAEMLSTAVFILPHEEGARLLARQGGQAIWIFGDGSSVTTDGYGALSQSGRS